MPAPAIATAQPAPGQLDAAALPEPDAPGVVSAGAPAALARTVLARASLGMAAAGPSAAGPSAAGPSAADPSGAEVDPSSPGTASGAGPSAGGQGGLDGGAPQQPSIAYEEAMAHEHDRIDFVPGGRVTAGFAPRADDRWPIDGKGPTALPAGRATGRDMAASPEGSQWAALGGSAPARPRADATPPQPVHAVGHGALASLAVAVASAPPAGDASPIDTPAGGTSVPATSAAYVTTGAGDTTRAGDPAIEPAAASGLRRQVFGFLPYWELKGASTRLNDAVLSTVAYFSVGADGAGNLRKRASDGSRTTGWAGWTSSDMSAVIAGAHQHGTRVVLTVSVFAWTTSQARVQASLLGSASARLALARQAAAAVRDRGADGINLDFEPLASGYESEFVALLRTMRSELNRIHAGYQLTYDTTGYIGNYPLEASVGGGAADAVFIMGYDYRTASSATAGSVDPLSGPKYDLADTVRAYTARISPARVILGIPWYGRAWSTSSAAARSANISSARYGYSVAVNYDTVVGLVARYGRRWDSVEQSPYVVYRRQTCTSRYGCTTSWRQVYYDDAASMKLRLALVNDYGLRGAGIWALGDDGGHAEPYRALSESFLIDKSAPQAGIVMLPTTTRDEGFVVRWSARDVSRVASYDVQVSVDGGPWAGWLARTQSTSDVWLGADGHGYAFRVRATDSKGNAGSWNTTSTWSPAPTLARGGFGRVTLDRLSYRAGPDTAAAKLGTLARGTIVAVTRGPVSSDGYTWWEVTQPVREWGPVSFVERGVWVAGGSSSATYVVPYRAPNSTSVDAGIRDLDFGGGVATGVGSAAAAIAVRSFSPNGDRSGDALQLRWTSTVAMDRLTLRVYRTDGTLVGTRSIPRRAKGAQSWSWNGRAGGSVVPDGRYVLQLVGVAGNRTYTAPSSRPVSAAQVAAYAVVVDRIPPTVTSFGSTITLISPNGDGQRDGLTLHLDARGATHWAVRIANTAGTTVRTATGDGRSLAFTWTGVDDRGRIVPDGRYTATLLAFDDAGNSGSRAVALRVDATPPVVTPGASPDVFSPNGDHALETTTLSWTSNEPAWGTARVWKGTRLIRSWAVSGVTAGSVTWNGRDAAGHPVGDGRYRFEVRVRDAGRSWSTASSRVVVDRTAAQLRWSGAFYPQDGDALATTSRLSWTQSRAAATTLRLYDARGRLVRLVWSSRGLGAGSHHWTWGGRLADGTMVATGRYEARLTVASRLGTVELRGSVWVVPYVATLSAGTVRAGQTLTIDLESVEPLASAPRVTFSQPGRTPVTVMATRRTDGGYRARFRVRSGRAGAATVTITARDAGGRLNRLTIPVRVVP